MIGQTELYAVRNPPSLSVHLLGRRITFMTVSAIIDAIHAACTEGMKLTVANYNVHSFNLSMQLPWFHNFLQSAEITHCDSVGILKAVSFMGLKLPLEYRASYSLLMPKLLSHCNQQGFSMFLLGAKPECLDAAIAQVEQQYPNLKISGHHGYFDIRDPQENGQVVRQINQTKPKILVVGMGMPTQEDWIRLNRDQLDVNVIMMGGAVIDRLAGIVPTCPPLLSNAGLEWLYRLCREPRRLATRYLLGNPAFAFHIALAKAYSFSLRVQLMEPISRAKKPSYNENTKSALTDLEHLGERLIEVDSVS
jgi:N-acetylglucosaminyldiphosphoundecaprenol N-acetyl-beta-D-mannosaminyltransferase